MRPLKITLDAPTDIYAPVIPAGWEALGTVRRADGGTGALLRNQRTGIYSELCGYTLRSLDQRAVAAALDGLKGGKQ